MRSKMAILAFIFVTIVAVFAYSLKPHPFDKHIDWLVENSEFEYNREQYPRIVYRSSEQMQIIAYTQNRLDEARAEGRVIPQVKALYNHNDNVMILENGTDIKSKETAYIIVHELVHFLQVINGVTTEETCIPSLEGPAYKLQYEWQKAHDHPGPYPNFLSVAMIVSSCHS